MLKSYQFNSSPKDSWIFKTEDFGRINLLVGISGSGKSRFLNIIFNMGTAISNSSPFGPGEWNVQFSIDDIDYDWFLDVNGNNKTDSYIEREELRVHKNGKAEYLVDRNKENFIFLDNKLPKLQKNIPSISLLKEEDSISPLYNMFAHIQRRLFHESGLRDAIAYQNVPLSLISDLKKDNDFEKMWKSTLTVNTKMYILQETYPDLYNIAIETFMEIFPFVQNCEVEPLDQSKIPMPVVPNSITANFSIKEKGVSQRINLNGLSSGMQKVLLIITDILTLPKNSIYIIDEYENSLGVNAIDFLPEFLLSHAPIDSQFFITTHHPYLINSMPIENWRIFNRHGSHVEVKSGSQLKDKYGKSKQLAFTQLMNDPLYTGEDI